MSKRQLKELSKGAGPQSLEGSEEAKKLRPGEEVGRRKEGID
jgi:hypothetical protein